MTDTLQKIGLQLEGLSIEKSIETLCSMFPDGVVFSTSLGLEDQVITDFIFKNDLPVRVFTLDTGRLFQETYDVLGLTNAKYKKNIQVYFPETASVETMLQSKGPNSFYQSVENRQECCQIRKIQPLQRALQGMKIWITGLRAEQSTNRQNMNMLEYDDRFGIIKYNPLLNWTLEDVEDYLEINQVPQNILHKKGYISIGCAPCTRAIQPGEDIRAGRWWWEQSHKECGLHSS